MSELALRLIAENKRTKDPFLDLSMCALKNTLPSSLIECEWLEKLDLSSWQKQDNGSKQLGYDNLNNNIFNNSSCLTILDRLTKLESLELGGCKISETKFLEKLTNLKIVDLGINQITDISFLEKLSSLKSLDISENQIIDISCLDRLTSLTFLDISSNQITNINSFEKLINLQSLSLGNNPIADISCFEKLTSLKFLNLTNSQIIDISFLEKLPHLKSLGLANNLINDVSFLENLTSLHSLNLANNLITEIPFKLIKKLPKLNNLFLYGNPIKNIPEEIFNKTYENVFQEIKDHFDSIEKKEDIFPLYEAKLLLVGRGFVGKSELAEALTKDDYVFEEGRKQTEGIKIKEWYPNGCKKEGENIDFKVNLWDFGGQEVYYGTHQFFLSKNAVYLLVWDARQEEDTRTFDYWLRAIGLLSQQSSVIIVQNKADQQTKELNQEDIVRNFPFVKGFYKTSCKLPDSYDNKKLQEHLVKELIALPHIGEPWNKHRVAVRRILEEDSRNYISEEKYIKICTENTLKSKEAFFLSDRLHNLGVILHFQDDDTLKRTVILKPEWATSAFYKIIDSKRIKEQNKGSFDKKDLSEVWNEEQYHSMIPELLKLMMKFELCFQYQNQNKYIVPEISSANPTFEIPTFSTNQPILEMVYQYEFMPKSIVTRFICRNHKDIKQNMFWQSGVVLEMDDCLALVESSEINKRITIKVSGKWANKVMYHIRKDIHIIHETVKNPPFDELIPCKSEECKSSGKPFYFKYETLIGFQKEGDRDIRCESCKKKMNIAELIEGVEEIESREINFLYKIIDNPMEGYKKNPEIFFSYAWGDDYEEGESREEIVNKLYENLKDDKYVVVRDKVDLGYKGLISSFMVRIGKGDFIVVAISDKYLKSPYCMYELYEVYRNSKLEAKGFIDKIYPIRVEQLNLNNPKVLGEYFEFWQNLEKEWEDLIVTFGTRITVAQKSEYDKIKEIAAKLGDLLDILKDMNSLTKQILSKDNFAEIKKAIEDRTKLN